MRFSQKHLVFFSVTRFQFYPKGIQIQPTDEKLKSPISKDELDRRKKSQHDLEMLKRSAKAFKEEGGEDDVDVERCRLSQEEYCITISMKI